MLLKVVVGEKIAWIMNAKRQQQIIGYVCVGTWLSKLELLNTEAETCNLLAVTEMVYLQILIIHELKKSSTAWILQLIKSHETEPPGRRLITCEASAHGPFRLGKPGAWGSGENRWSQKRRVPVKKWSQKENTRGKTLEMGEDPGDQGDAWRWVPGVPSNVGHWRSRPVAGSSGTAGPDPAFWSSIPEEPWPAYGGHMEAWGKRGGECRR